METARALIRIAILILIVGGFNACTPVGEISVPVYTPTPRETQTSLPPSLTPSPRATVTSTVTLLPPSPTPTHTFTPTIPPTPAPLGCWQQGGSIVSAPRLSTPLSPLPWEFRLYLPPCYNEQPDRHYPLLILIHGSTYNDDQWDRLGADETADALITTGELPPFLILMPRDRIWTDDPRDDPFGEALIQYIIPWMDENYRTLPSREYRAIGGLSRGASWAVNLGLSHWEMFEAIGAHSLPVFVTDPPRLRKWLEAIPPDSMPRFFLDIGEKDRLLEYALWFENLLSENNIPHEWYLYTGTHEEAYWQAHMEQYLRWYAETWSHLQ